METLEPNSPIRASPGYPEHIGKERTGFKVISRDDYRGLEEEHK